MCCSLPAPGVLPFPWICPLRGVCGEAMAMLNSALQGQGKPPCSAICCNTHRPVGQRGKSSQPVQAGTAACIWVCATQSSVMVFLLHLPASGLIIRLLAASLPVLLYGSRGSKGVKPQQFPGRQRVISDKAVYISNSLFLTQCIWHSNTAAGLMLKPSFSQGTAISAVRGTLKNVLPNCSCLIRRRSVPAPLPGCAADGGQAKLGGLGSLEQSGFVWVLMVC